MKLLKLLRSTYKSLDTEENIDLYFTRPIGLLFALFFKKIGWTPNAVTILSYFLGMGAAWMFHYEDLWHNICGVLLLMTANFCDSADGQLARLTGQKSLTGRMLDGFATEFWFICIYLALAWRLESWWFLALACVAGFGAHNYQCRLADYYRNIHLFFLKGKEGAELDTYAEQQKIYEQHRRDRNWVGILFFSNYAKYCKKQEESTPEFQALRRRIVAEYGSMSETSQEFREEFLRGSRPLMKYTNFVSYNWRAIMLYVACLTNIPWIAPIFELTVLMAAALYMKHKHEALCKRLLSVGGFLIDYGGTLDTRGEHWSKVIWRAYQQHGIPVTWELYYEAYVAAERRLGQGDIILPTDTFSTTLSKKIHLQLEYLKLGDNISDESTALAESIYAETVAVTSESRQRLQKLRDAYRCPMVLVSNFYGNIRTVLREFRLDEFFVDIVESAEVGIRKPDSRIWQLAIERLKIYSPTPLRAEDITVIGDSEEKDLAPARSLGCKVKHTTEWIRNSE